MPDITPDTISRPIQFTDILFGLVVAKSNMESPTLKFLEIEFFVVPIFLCNLTLFPAVYH